MNEFQITNETFKNTRLMIGSNLYGSKCQGPYAISILALMKLCYQLRLVVGFASISNESLIQRSRNYVVDEFLRSDCTHLMLIDTDIQFNPEDVLALLLLNQDIIGVPYPEKKDVNWDLIISSIKNNPVQKDPTVYSKMTGENFLHSIQNLDPTKMISVDVLKPGFMMIKRNVFDRLRISYPEHYYRPDHVGIAHFGGERMIQMYFSVEIDPKTRKLLTEYEFFCKMWRDIGGKIFICPWMVVSHIGLHKY